MTPVGPGGTTGAPSAQRETAPYGAGTTDPTGYWIWDGRQWVPRATYGQQYPHSGRRHRGDYTSPSPYAYPAPYVYGY